MKLSEVRLPRHMEAAGESETTYTFLLAGATRLWQGGEPEYPRIVMEPHLEQALRNVALSRRITCGYEDIEKTLVNEARGIAALERRSNTAQGGRISRLVLCSNDGSERFYRRLERLVQSHAPRVLCCILDSDAESLGAVVSGPNRRIKAILVEHKDAVSAVLRALTEQPQTNR